MCLSVRLTDDFITLTFLLLLEKLNLFLQSSH